MEHVKLQSLLTAAVIQLLLLAGAQATNCRGSAADLAFLLDSSGSICDSDPDFDYNRDSTCNNWNYIIQFVKSIVSAFDIGPEATRVAVVTFATTAILRWNLTAISNKADLLTAIQLNIPYSKGGQTNTAEGLKIVRTVVFNVSEERESVPRICFIITDGNPTDPSTVLDEIYSVQDVGIATFVVGITDRIDEPTLKLLSSPPHVLNVNYFMASDFRNISTIANFFQPATGCDSTLTLPANHSTVSTKRPETSTTVRSSGCGDSAKDLAILLDGSGSICGSDSNSKSGSDKTCSTWIDILYFVTSFVFKLDIGPEATRVGLVTSGTDVVLRFNLTAFSDNNEFQKAILVLPYPGGERNTSGGLRTIRTEVFNVSGDRQSVPNTCIIITVGNATDPSTVPDEIESVHAAGIRTIAVGITNKIDEQTLQLLSSPPKQLDFNYFMTSDSSTINTIKDRLLSVTKCATLPANQSSVSTKSPETSTTVRSFESNKPTVSSTTSTEIGIIIGLVLGIPLVLVIIILAIIVYRRKTTKSLQITGENTNYELSKQSDGGYQGLKFHVYGTGACSDNKSNDYSEIYDQIDDAQSDHYDQIDNAQPDYCVQIHNAQPDYCVQIHNARPDFWDIIDDDQPDYCDQIHNDQPDYWDLIDDDQPDYLGPTGDAQPAQCDPMDDAQPDYLDPTDDAQPDQSDPIDDDQPDYLDPTDDDQPDHCDQTDEDDQTNQHDQVI